VGCALDFDGAGDSVSVGILIPSNELDAFTISLWVSFNETPEHADSLLHRDSWSLGFLHTMIAAGHPPGYHQLSINGNEPVDVVAATPNIPAPAGTWVHLAVTYDSSSASYAFFRDGEPDGSGTYELAGTAVVGPLHIASWGDSRFLSAKLDDVGLWDHALARATIEAIHAAGIQGRDQTSIHADDFESGTISGWSGVAP